MTIWKKDRGNFQFRYTMDFDISSNLIISMRCTKETRQKAEFHIESNKSENLLDHLRWIMADLIILYLTLIWFGIFTANPWGGEKMLLRIHWNTLFRMESSPGHAESKFLTGNIFVLAAQIRLWYEQSEFKKDVVRDGMDEPRGHEKIRRGSKFSNFLLREPLSPWI